MKIDDLVSALAKLLPQELAEELVDFYVRLRRDVKTSSLGRADAGKFVETFCQAVQFLETGAYDPKPAVDAILTRLESSSSGLDDGIRICGSRIARAMYALRSKRNIVHKGSIDSNTFDLNFLLAGSQWVLSEFLRHAKGLTMEEAGTLISKVQSPASSKIDDFSDKKLVLKDVGCREEALILLLTAYPDWADLGWLRRSLDRRPAKTVSNVLGELWNKKLIEKRGQTAILTTKGFEAAEKALINLGEI